MQKPLQAEGSDKVLLVLSSLRFIMTKGSDYQKHVINVGAATYFDRYTSIRMMKMNEILCNVLSHGWWLGSL